MKKRGAFSKWGRDLGQGILQRGALEDKGKSGMRIRLGRRGRLSLLKVSLS